MNEWNSIREARVSLGANSSNLVRTILLQATEDDRGEEGPRHQEWNRQYQHSLGVKLVAAGFTKNEVQKIITEFFGCLTSPRGRVLLFLCMLWFILTNLRRLWKAKVAIEQEFIEEGEPPPWNE